MDIKPSGLQDFSCNADVQGALLVSVY